MGVRGSLVTCTTARPGELSANGDEEDPDDRRELERPREGGGEGRLGCGDGRLGCGEGRVEGGAGLGGRS